jgi:hypothetical protein
MQKGLRADIDRKRCIVGPLNKLGKLENERDTSEKAELHEWGSSPYMPDGITPRRGNGRIVGAGCIVQHRIYTRHGKIRVAKVHQNVNQSFLACIIFENAGRDETRAHGKESSNGLEKNCKIL